MTGGDRVEVAPERLAAWLTALRVEHPGAEPVLERFDHDPLGIVLIRRGGYAVGLAHAGRLTARKVGRRHVQGRTAAGGWSQQRFARRRAGQADELVEAVAAHAAALLAGPLAAAARAARPGGIPGPGLVVGGDRALVAAVLAEPPLRPLLQVPRRELPDLPNPDGRVLERAAWRGRAVRVSGLPADPR